MINNAYKDFALVSSIPKDWNAQPIKRFLISHDGGAWGEDAKGNAGDCICIRIADFDYSKGTIKNGIDLTVRNYPQNIIDRLSLKKGDIIIEKSGGGDKTPVGRSIVFRQNYNALFANFSERLRVQSKYNSEFVNYCLRAFYSIGGSFNYFNQTTGIQNLSMGKYLSDIYLPCPKRRTQDAIVRYLDSKCSAIDEAIERHKKIIEKLEEYKRSKIAAIVYSGLKNEEKQQTEEWCGAIPVGWTLPRIKFLLRERNVRSETGTEEPLSMSQKVGLVPTKELGDIPHGASTFIGAKIVEPNDLVFNKLKAHLGVFSVSRYFGLVSPDYAVYMATEKADAKYLEYVFKTPHCIGEFIKRATGVGQGLTRLYTDQLFDIKCPCPPIEEQHEIAEYLNDISARVFEAKEKEQVIIEKLEEYRKSIIYNAVTGKIDCREAVK